MVLVALYLCRTMEAGGDLLGNGIWQFRLKCRIVILDIWPVLNSLEKTTAPFLGTRRWKVGSFHSPEKGVMGAAGWRLMQGKFTCETEKISLGEQLNMAANYS